MPLTIDLTWYDHGLALLLAFGLPLFGLFEFRRLRHRAGRGPASARLWAYRKLLVEEWSVVALAVGLWFWLDRPWGALGLVPASVEAWRLGLGTAAALGGILLLEAQRRQVQGDPEAREVVREELSGLRPLLPHDDREIRWFRAVSVTAGVCEELLYRGFLLVYLGSTMPMPVAVVLASLVFGFGHIYQGQAGILKTGGLGAFFCVLYLLTGSLFIPMMVHVAIDWINGGIARSLLQEDWG